MTSRAAFSGLPPKAGQLFNFTGGGSPSAPHAYGRRQAEAGTGSMLLPDSERFMLVDVIYLSVEALVG